MTAITNIVDRSPPDDGGVKCAAARVMLFSIGYRALTDIFRSLSFSYWRRRLSRASSCRRAGKRFSRRNERPLRRRPFRTPGTSFTALPKKIDDYLHDRFGLRKQMIGWHANLTKRLLREGNEQVLVGRGGRMFYLSERRGSPKRRPRTARCACGGDRSIFSLQCETL